MLQLLVAMSCLVGVAYLNGNARVSQQDVVLHVRQQGGEPFRRIESRLGWPFTYRITITHTLQSTNDPWVRAGKPFTINADQFRNWYATLNALCGIVVALRVSRPMQGAQVPDPKPCQSSPISQSANHDRT